MRAEGQAHIDRIEAALALVRKSLDWEHALRRLDDVDEVGADGCRSEALARVSPQLIEDGATPTHLLANHQRLFPQLLVIS